MTQVRDYHGRVLSVTEQHVGGSLTQDESAGATTLHLSDVDWASDDGDDNDIYIHRGKEHNHYNSVNDGAKTIHLTAGTTQAYPAGTIVEPWNPDTRTRWAEILVEGSEYEERARPVIVHIPGHYVNMMPVGTRHKYGERVILRHDNRWRLFIHDVIGVNGDTVLWMYQTTPLITDSLSIYFRPPYDAHILEVRSVAQEPGSTNTVCNVRHDPDGIINVKDIVIQNGKRASDWIKIGGDRGKFVEDDERIRCTVDTLGTGVTGPIHFEFRAVPKGAG
jgi:hypothetical protein